MRLAEVGCLLRRLADRPAERLVFVAASELNETAPAKTVAISARHVAVAIDACVDIVGEAARIVAIGRRGLRAWKQRRPHLAGPVGRIVEVLDGRVQRRPRLDEEL